MCILKKLGFLFILLFCLLLPGCSEAPLARTDFLFDTVVTVKLYRGGDEATLDRVFDRLRELDRLLDVHGDGPLAVLNRDGEAELPAEAAALLERAQELSALTGGAYDPALGAVTGLYTFGEGAVPPDPAAVAEALPRTGSDKLEVSGTHAALADGARVDLGGIAKGYASAEAARLLEEEGVEAALVDLGGNIVTVGEKSPPFRIAVRSPSGEAEAAALLTPEYRAAVTAGTYQRCFTYDGVLYHHILDPATGEPVRNGVQSVTVLADDPTLADALSTAALVLGPERGLALVESLPDVEALFLLEDGTERESSGFSRSRAD